MPVGHPLKFGTNEQLQAEIDSYFSVVPKEEWTITGLAFHLDTSRRVLMEYEVKDGYSNTIKRAKCKIEAEYERRGWGGKSPAFAIFALKNFDWSDKSDHALTDGEGRPLNMVPHVSIIDFTTYLQSKKDAESRPQDMVEGLQGTPVDGTNQEEPGTSGV